MSKRGACAPCAIWWRLSRFPLFRNTCRSLSAPFASTSTLIGSKGRSVQNSTVNNWSVTTCVCAQVCSRWAERGIDKTCRKRGEAWVHFFCEQVFVQSFINLLFSVPHRSLSAWWLFRSRVVQTVVAAERRDPRASQSATRAPVGCKWEAVGELIEREGEREMVTAGFSTLDSARGIWKVRRRRRADARG